MQVTAAPLILRLLLLACFIPQFVLAQDAESIASIHEWVGQSSAFVAEAMREAKYLGMGSFGRTNDKGQFIDYEHSYELSDLGQITIRFYDDRAGYFQLSLSKPQQTEEALAALLAIDLNNLPPGESGDGYQIRSSFQKEIAFEEVVTVGQADKWSMLIVKMKGYPHEVY